MSGMNLWLAGFFSCLTMYLMRMISLTFLRKPIKNRFLQSFLAYIPTAVFTSLVFPEVFHCTSHVASAFVGLITAVVLSYLEKGILTVCLSSVSAVFVAERILEFLNVLPK